MPSQRSVPGPGRVHRANGGSAGPRSEGLEAERSAAVERLADLQLRDAKLRERFAQKVGEGDNDGAKVIEETLAQQRPEAEAAEWRVANLDERLAVLAEEHPADPGLDFWSSLRGELEGILSRGTIREVREGLDPMACPPERRE